MKMTDPGVQGDKKSSHQVCKATRRSGAGRIVLIGFKDGGPARENEIARTGWDQGDPLHSVQYVLVPSSLSFQMLLRATILRTVGLGERPVRMKARQFEYRKILLNEHHRREDDLDLLSNAGECGWELVAITPNNVAYLKRELLQGLVHEKSDQQQQENYPTGVKPKYSNPATGETWSGRGRMATWLKSKRDAGEDIAKYRVQTVG